MADDNGHDEDVKLEIRMDELGNPILLATRAPGQVAAQPNNAGTVRRGAASGNPNADIASGRFTSKDSAKAKPGEEVVQQTKTAQPQGVTSAVIERRRDIVREAARTLDDTSPEKIASFLKEWAADPSQVNVDAFVADVREQQMDDLVDILDAQMRSRSNSPLIALKTNIKTTKRIFNGLDDAQAVRLVQRLVGKGWDMEDVNKNVVSRIADKSRKAALEQIFGEPKPKSGKKFPKATNAK